MKAYQGPAVLRWWGNNSFAVGLDVVVTVEETLSGWDTRLLVSTDEDQRGVEELSNPWMLLFPDGSSFDVDAEAISERTWTVSPTTGRGGG